MGPQGPHWAPIVWANASVTVIRGFCNGDQKSCNGSKSSNVSESSNVSVRVLAMASSSGYGFWLRLLASSLGFWVTPWAQASDGGDRALGLIGCDRALSGFDRS